MTTPTFSAATPSDFRPGDLARATKGTSVIQGPVRRHDRHGLYIAPEVYGLDVEDADVELDKLHRAGFTLERAATPLAPGWYEAERYALDGLEWCPYIVNEDGKVFEVNSWGARTPVGHPQGLNLRPLGAKAAAK